MQWVHALLLGILEGVTEFLPVSSTGHLILAEKLLAIPPSGFAASFTIAIQLGAILAVLALYGRTLLVSRTLFLRLFAAFVPTAICGAILYGVVKAIFLQSTAIVLVSMLAGGVVLLLFELCKPLTILAGRSLGEGWALSRLSAMSSRPNGVRWWRQVPPSPTAVGEGTGERAPYTSPSPPAPPPLRSGRGEHDPLAPTLSLDTITYRQAVGIGLIQSFAMVPGVSRSAASIIGGLALGLPRKTAVEFSFLLAVPTMIAATSLDLAKNGAAFTGNEWLLLGIGGTASFLAALAAIRWLLRFLQRHTFIPFAMYRILAAPVFWWLLML